MQVGLEDCGHLLVHALGIFAEPFRYKSAPMAQLGQCREFRLLLRRIGQHFGYSIPELEHVAELMPNDKIRTGKARPNFACSFVGFAPAPAAHLCQPLMRDAELIEELQCPGPKLRVERFLDGYERRGMDGRGGVIDARPAIRGALEDIDKL